MANLKNTTVNDTGFLQLPVGTTEQRPTPAAGQMRFNTTLGRAEFYNATQAAWKPTINQGVIATGGTVYDVDTEGTTYRVHVFTSTGNSTFTVTQGGSVEYLIIAGGGGGGSSPTNNNDGCGGGGAGGLLTGFTAVTPQAYTITVGVGGQGINSSLTPGTDGGNSSAFGQLAIGGGGGATQNQSGRSGGSGGGAGNGGAAGPFTGGAGTAGQGNAGGNVTTSANNWVGAGGGGAGEDGRSGNQGTTDQGRGGNGLVSFISGTLTFYAGGGGGGASGGRLGGGGGNSGLPPLGGLGGGAEGGYEFGKAPNATPNTGGGGAGATGNTGAWGGNGGSGIVVIRYPLRQENPVSATGKVAGDGLVLDLDFAKPTVYAGSGTVVSDSRLNGITGTLNGPTISNQRTHRAEAVYTGNQSITITASGISVTNTSFSIQWWVRKTLVGQPHIQIGGGSRTNIGDVSAGVSIGTASNVQSFRAQITDGSVNRRITIDPFGFQSNTWTMITYVVNRSNGTAQLYKDSVLVGNLSLGTFGNSTNSNTMTIGGANGSAKSIVKFYNIPLSANQVQQEYNATRWRFGV